MKNSLTVLNFPKHIISVSGGEFHSLAVAEDGSLYSWGSNEFGQLGLSRQTQSVTTPTLIPHPEMFLQVAAGQSFSLALDSNGNVWAFGSNNKCQLGVSDVSFLEVPTKIESSSLGNERITKVSAGLCCSVLLDSKGNLWTFGDNSYCNLGIGDNYPRKNPTRVSLREETAVNIACGFHHTLVLDSQARLWVFGWNKFGQLGFDSLEYFNFPELHPALGNIAQVYCQGSLSIVQNTLGDYFVFGKELNNFDHSPKECTRWKNKFIFPGGGHTVVLDNEGNFHIDGHIANVAEKQSRLSLSSNSIPRVIGNAQVQALQTRNEALTRNYKALKTEHDRVSIEAQNHQEQLLILQERLKIQQELNRLLTLEVALLQQEESCQPLKVAELADFFVTDVESEGNSGSFGIVHRVKTNWHELLSRVPFPYLETNRDGTTIWDYVALKMLYCFVDRQQNTAYNKYLFDQEYHFPLAHPHWSIIRVFNYFRACVAPSLIPKKDPSFADLLAPKTAYFTMEIGEGSLSDYLKAHPITDLRSCFLIVLQLCIGAAHIASCGYVHKDMKLENVIWLTHSRRSVYGNQFVTGDLATASPTQFTVAHGSNFTASPQNRPPEFYSLRGESLFDKQLLVEGRGADVWAIGCMLFEMLQGHHPFAKHNCDVRENVCVKPPPRLDSKWAGAQKLLDWMWMKNPHERITSYHASRICAMLLWNFPFNTNVTLEVCTNWLNARRSDLCSRIFQNEDSPKCVEVELFLELHILLHTPASDLLHLAQTYNPNS